MTQLVSVSALFDEPHELPFLVDRLVPAEGITVLYAASGIGKTHTVLDMAMCTALGREWMHRSVRRGNVCYLVGEGFAGFPARARAWCTEHDVGPQELDPHFVFRRTALDISDPVDREVLCTELEAHNMTSVDLLVVDTLSANTAPGFDESKTKDMKLFLDGARAMRDRLHCAVLIIHHSGWDASRYRGSSDLLGAVDASLSLRSEGDHTRVLHVEKARDFAAPEPIRFNLVPKHGGVILAHIASSTATLTPAQRQCVVVLGEHGGAMRPTEWKDATGHSRSYFHRLREEVLAAGAVEKSGGEYRLTPVGEAIFAAFRATEGVPGDVPTMSLETGRSMSPLNPLSIDRGQGTSGTAGIADGNRADLALLARQVEEGEDGFWDTLINEAAA
jgi:hypothetical protein